MRLFLAVLVLALAGTAGWWFLIGAEQVAAGRLRPDDAAFVSQGRAVYVEHCAACHGLKLEGQPDWQTRKANGRLPAPPQDASGHTWHHPDSQLIELVRKGPAAIAGGGYESDMPAFQTTLSETDIVAALSYIASTWPAEIRARHDRVNAEAAAR